MKKITIAITFLFVTYIGFAQDSLIKKGEFLPIKISNIDLFSEFFERTEKSLLILGENHSSSVAGTVFPELVKYHHQENGVNTLLIEFGPSEAYFYTRYLETGEEKYFNYTIYAGYYKDWKKAWREIYEYNQSIEGSLDIVGVDFDRTRTFAYALYNILKEYPERPAQIDSLMNVIKDEKFFKTYTIGYPTDQDKMFVADTKKIVRENLPDLIHLLAEKDVEVVQELLNNNAVGFEEGREENITKNIVEALNNSEEDNFLMLVGRDHAYLDAIYDDKPRLATKLREEPSISILTGVILHENSQQWGKDYKEKITLFEVRDKNPWQEYYEQISQKANTDFTVIPLNEELKPLSSYLDYIFIARNQGPISF